MTGSRQNKITASICPAVSVTTKAAANILDRLKKKYGADLTSEFAVDPTLLGGVRVRVGSDVWDGTLRNRLERLQQQL